jgi:hypothetical protein
MIQRKKWTPREYQPIACDFLYHTPRCNLWAKPGMGKTGTVYMALDLLKLCGSNFFPALVLGPKGVCETVWPEEVKLWDAFADLRCVPILGDVRAREDALCYKSDVYCINYDNIPWLVNRLGKKWPFKTVIADESTKLKNFRHRNGGVRAAALNEIAKHTGRWINATGTPATNGLKDLWGQQWFVDFGHRLKPTYTAFFDTWFRTDRYTNRVKPFDHSEKQIHDLLADCTMALRPEDWFDIKQPLVFRKDVRLPDEALGHYREMERQYFTEIDGKELEAVNALAKSQKLLQMASGSVYDASKTPVWVHDAKVEMLESIINEQAGENILVVYHYKHEAQRLLKHFPGSRIYRGKQDEDDWNAGKIPILLLQPMSAGHGKNLQHGGRTMVFFTHTWDLELRLQVIERIGPTRQAQSGYDRAVMIYDICAIDTLDNEVMARNEGKLSVLDALMAARARFRGEEPSRIVTPINAEMDKLLAGLL